MYRGLFEFFKTFHILITIQSIDQFFRIETKNIIDHDRTKRNAIKIINDQIRAITSLTATASDLH